MDPESLEMEAKNKVEYERYFDSQKFSTLIKTGDHKQIIKWIKMKKLSLQSLDRQTSSWTLLSQILEEVANGHLIVNEILNTYVRPTNPSLKPNSNDFSIDLDFSGITHQSDDEIGEQKSAVTDLVRLVLEHKGNWWSRNFSHALDFIMPDACLTWQRSIRPNPKLVCRIKGTHTLIFNQIKQILPPELMCHPVMACFITLKWKKILMYFACHILLLLFFLISFYFYIRCIFQFMQVEGTESGNKNTQKATTLPFFLTDTSKPSLFLVEGVFAISTLLLCSLEIYQLFHLKCQNYWKQFENWNQTFVITSAVLAMVIKPWILEKSVTGEILRGITALGFCASCFDFIFTLGKYPFRGGDFSIMFTRVLTRLSNYVVGMFILIGGFSTSLEIVSHGTDVEGFHAESPFKNFVLTLTMAMGEFNARDLYNEFMGDHEDPHWKIGRTFAFGMLVFLVLAGTITMVNLFVAVIIKDTNHLEGEVFKEKLFYMAESLISIRNLVPQSRQAKLAINSSMTFCVHEMCAANCEKSRVPSNISHLEPELLKLALADHV